MKKYKYINALAVFFLLSLALGAQDTGRSSLISEADLYIGFLSTHGVSVDQRTTEQTARRLDVKPSDVLIIDEAARAFIYAQESLRAEARQYFASRGGARDDVAARSFSNRREALAREAFGDLKGQLSPESYAALQTYLARFSQGIKKVVPVDER